MEIAEISDILRQNSNIDILSKNITKKIANYLNTNQVGIYVTENTDKEPILVLKSHFAYGRLKYEKRTFHIGEGIIGQAYLEKEHVLITDIPNDYFHITSGLGEALPRNVIIVPLKHDNEVFGIIEIASFTEFTSTEIQFLLKISEALASSLKYSADNELTNKLLQESRQQSNELKSKEEELHQNLEELQSIQETMIRNQNEIKIVEARNNAILENNPLGIIILGKNGKIHFSNSVANTLLEIDQNTIDKQYE